MKLLNFNLIRMIAAVVALLAITTSVHARDYRYHEGYTGEVMDERNEVVSEMAMIEAPAPLGPPLQHQIFDEKITRDFRERYEQKFGRTEAERVYNSPNRFTYYTDLYTFKGSPQEEDIEKKAYAEYMVKKLAEYHVENYMKSDPKTKSVWEAKERVSQMSVKSKGYKFNARYDLIGGKADLQLDNPFAETKYTLEMSGTKVQEALLVLKRNLIPTYAIESRYKQVEGILAFIGTKTFSPFLSANITVSTFTNNSTKSTRESLYLLGTSYVF